MLGIGAIIWGSPEAHRVCATGEQGGKKRREGDLAVEHMSSGFAGLVPKLPQISRLNLQPGHINFAESQKPIKLAITLDFLRIVLTN